MKVLGLKYVKELKENYKCLSLFLVFMLLAIVL